MFENDVNLKEKGNTNVPTARSEATDSSAGKTQNAQQGYEDEQNLRVTSQAVPAEDDGQEDDGSFFKAPVESTDNRYGDDDRFGPNARYDLDRLYDDDFEDVLVADQQMLASQTPEPRPGMVQRWVRAISAESDGTDTSNYTRKRMQGFLPRPLDSIPEKYIGYNPRLSKAKTADQGVYQVAELILMEMPAVRMKKLSQRGRDIVDERTKALGHNLKSKANPRDEQSGFGEFSANIRTSSGRIPIIADD